MKTMNDLYAPVAYRAFVENQVLTEQQLNEIIAYFNYQDRLSRVLLNGVGIVCGLQVSLGDNESNELSIMLKEGVAVTTAGNLLKVDYTEYTKFRKFEDRSAAYKLFRGENDEVIDLFELVTEKAGTDLKTLEEFNNEQELSLDEMVVVLYLETYLQPEKKCSPKGCDSQGPLMVEKIRILLVSREDAKNLLPHKLGDPQGLKKLLETVYVPRKILKDEDTKAYEKFKKLYKTDFSGLKDRLSAWNETGLIGSLDLDSLPDDSDGFPENKEKYFQYHYDFYKDLAEVYNETIKIFKDGYSFCCPDPKAFPKHVMLGTFDSELGYRHPFFPSKTHNKAGIEDFKAGFIRMKEMISRYSAYNSLSEVIKITPSLSGDVAFTDKAIPFYYPVKDQHNDQLYNQWTKRDFAPNYYRYGHPQFVENVEDVEDLLQIELKGHDFYRIEGHIGRSVFAALKELTEIRNNNGLPFDIIPLSIGDSVPDTIWDLDRYVFRFRDLEILRDNLLVEQLCIYEKVLKFLYRFPTDGSGELKSPDVIVKEEDEKPVKSKQVGGRRDGSGLPTKLIHIKDLSSGYKDIPGTIGNMEYGTRKLSIGNKENVYNLMIQNHSKTNNDARDSIVKSSIGLVKLIGRHIESEIYNDTDTNNYSKQIKEDATKQLDELKVIRQEDNEITKESWFPEYIKILELLINSCVDEKIERINEEIINRKNELLAELVLSRFIEDHPGAEHRAGVEKGGTFILVYNGAKQDPLELLDEFNSISINRANLINLLEYLKTEGFIDILTYGITGRGLIIIVPSIDEFKLGMFLKWSISREFISLKVSINDIINTIEGLGLNIYNLPPVNIYTAPDKTAEEEYESFLENEAKKKESTKNILGKVVGDLSLPYLCCSKAPAATFVFPEQPVFLLLGSDAVCVEKDKDTKVSMVVLPEGAEVKVFTGKEEGEVEIDGLISEDGNFILVHNLPEQYYNQDLRFEVNGQKMDPILLVLKYPEPKFSVDANLIDGFIELKLTNETENFSELTFKWEVNDITLEEEVNNQEIIEIGGISVDDFQVDNSQYKVTVKLTAFNGICESEKVESFVIPEQPVILLLGSDTVCVEKDKDTKVSMEVHPPEADVKVFVGKEEEEEEIKGLVNEDEGGKYIIASDLPDEYYGEALRFEVNGQKMNPVLQVFKKPEPEFTYTYVVNGNVLELILTNKTESLPNLKFEWQVNDKKMVGEEDGNKTRMEIPIEEFPFNVSVKLIASNEICPKEELKKDFVVNKPKEEEKEPCYSKDFFECWTIREENTLKYLLEWRKISHEWNSEVTDDQMQELLNSLNDSKGFYWDELICMYNHWEKSNHLEYSIEFLQCLGLDPNRYDISKSTDFANIIIEFQAKRCKQNESQFEEIYKEVTLNFGDILRDTKVAVSITVSGRSFIPNNIDRDLGYLILNCISYGTEIKISADGYADVKLNVKKSVLNDIFP